jgi:hypothetical protein
MIKGFLNLPWFLWAAAALIIAVVFAFVWPQNEALGAAGFRFFIIRWGHTLTWILLGVNFILRGISPDLNGVANLFALAGGIVYLLFIVMTFVVK